MKTVPRIALLVSLGLGVSHGLAADDMSPQVVEIVAKRFEFTPKEVHLQKGKPVTLRLRSEDVTHGFFARKLKIDAEILPGKTTDVTITPSEAGTTTVICNHFCGGGHGNMKMKIVVE